MYVHVPWGRRLIGGRDVDTADARVAPRLRNHNPCIVRLVF